MPIELLAAMPLTAMAGVTTDGDEHAGEGAHADEAEEGPDDGRGLRFWADIGSG